LHSIDFRELRRRIAISDVLSLLSFEPTQSQGSRLRGTCPIHESRRVRKRDFSIDLDKSRFRCFGCGKGGNQLDLWVFTARSTGHGAQFVPQTPPAAPYVAQQAYQPNLVQGPDGRLYPAPWVGPLPMPQPVFAPQPIFAPPPLQALVQGLFRDSMASAISPPSGSTTASHRRPYKHSGLL